MIRNLWTGLIIFILASLLWAQAPVPGNVVGFPTSLQPTGTASGIDVNGSYPSSLTVVGLGGGDATYASHILTLPSATGVYAISTDVGLSRCAAFQFCVGNGTQGNKVGSLQLASLGSATAAATGWSMNYNAFGLNLGPSLPVNWGANNQTTGYDTSLSRDAAGVVDIGTGAQGSAAGAGKMTVLRNVATLFTNLSTSYPNNGDSGYCSDCTVTSGSDDTCAGSGSGAFLTRLNGVYRCRV